MIVSTGLGSTGWLASLIAGARGIAVATGMADSQLPMRTSLPWDAPTLVFTVREPFPSRNTATDMVFGHVSGNAPLVLESQMAERGVIFSDGVEADFLGFNSGARVEIRIAERRGRLAV